MNPTAGAGNGAKTPRLPKREAPISILRRWRRNSELRNAAGETRVLSFLVCRMRGFDGLVASYAADPDGLCHFVRRGTTALADAVRAHGGTIDRMFAGGFSAYFNAPRDSNVHVVKSCECALALLAAVEELNRKLPAVTDPISIGIGLNSGIAILGDFGTEDQPCYAAVGPASERADALERLSATYGAAILAGHATEKDAEHSFAFLRVDQHAQGDAEPLPVWAMLAPPLSRANPKFVALKSFHAHIFEALHAQNWNEARNLIGQCRALSGANSVLYDFYLQRIAHYETNPPPPDWNGVLMPAQS